MYFGFSSGENRCPYPLLFIFNLTLVSPGEAFRMDSHFLKSLLVRREKLGGEWRVQHHSGGEGQWQVLSLLNYVLISAPSPTHVMVSRSEYVKKNSACLPSPLARPCLTRGKSRNVGCLPAEHRQPPPLPALLLVLQTACAFFLHLLFPSVCSSRQGASLQRRTPGKKA